MPKSTKPKKARPYGTKTKVQVFTQVNPTYNGKPVKANIRIIED